MSKSWRKILLVGCWGVSCVAVAASENSEKPPAPTQALLRINLERLTRREEQLDYDTSLLEVEQQKVNRLIAELTSTAFREDEARQVVARVNEAATQRSIGSFVGDVMSLARPPVTGRGDSGGFMYAQVTVVDDIYASVGLPPRGELPESVEAVRRASNASIGGTIVPPAEMKKLLSAVNVLDIASSFESNRNEMLSYFRRVLDALSAQILANKDARASLEKQIAGVDAQITDEQRFVDSILIWAIVGMILVVPVLYFATRLFSVQIQQMVFLNRVLVELIGMAFLLLTIIILGTAQKIERSVVGTLLGTVGGYIFGQSLSARRERSGESWESKSNKQ